MRPIPEGPDWATPHIVPSPYQRTRLHLRLPAALPQAVTDAFTRAAVRQQEAGALLYGTRGSGPGHPDTVRALVIPDQVSHQTHYRVPYDGIAAASAVTRELGLVTLAQVHSHPGSDVEHSWYDDRHAISTRAVSFVLPHYGRHADSWLDRAGVHDYQHGWWHLLTANQVTERVSFIDAPLHVIDLSLEIARTV